MTDIDKALKADVVENAKATRHKAELQANEDRGAKATQSRFPCIDRILTQIDLNCENRGLAA